MEEAMMAMKEKARFARGAKVIELSEEMTARHVSKGKRKK
jgi:hypothetical protein